MEPFAGSLTHLASSLNVEAVALNQQTLAAMDQQLASLSDGGAAYSMLQQPPYYSSPSTAERQVCSTRILMRATTPLACAQDNLRSWRQSRT